MPTKNAIHKPCGCYFDKKKWHFCKEAIRLYKIVQKDYNDVENRRAYDKHFVKRETKGI